MTLINLFVRKILHMRKWLVFTAHHISIRKNTRLKYNPQYSIYDNEFRKNGKDKKKFDQKKSYCYIRLWMQRFIMFDTLFKNMHQRLEWKPEPNICASHLRVLCWITENWILLNNRKRIVWIFFLKVIDNNLFTCCRQIPYYIEFVERETTQQKGNNYRDKHLFQ